MSSAFFSVGILAFALVLRRSIGSPLQHFGGVSLQSLLLRHTPSSLLVTANRTADSLGTRTSAQTSLRLAASSVPSGYLVIYHWSSSSSGGQTCEFSPQGTPSEQDSYALGICVQTYQGTSYVWSALVRSPYIDIYEQQFSDSACSIKNGSPSIMYTLSTQCELSSSGEYSQSAYLPSIPAFPSAGVSYSYYQTPGE